MTPRFAITAGIRSVAIFEGAKGLLVLLAGFGLMSLVHRDVSDVAEHLIRQFHLDPANKYPRLFLDAANCIDDRRLLSMAFLALLISVLRLIQAYGLWHQRKWAEWLSVVAAGVFLPVEIYHLARHATWLKWGMLIANLGIVAFLLFVLRQSHGRSQTVQGDSVGYSGR